MGEKPKILIVDDKIENHIALEKVLNDVNVKFVRAMSGNEALSLLLEQNFALALIDVQMPEMDGFEMIEIVRQDEKTKHLPVIFLSAIYKDEYYQIKGIQSGAFDFITKPIVPEILVGKVRLFLNLHEHMSKRRMAEEELKKHRDHLEEIVKKRTEELTNAKDMAEAASRTKNEFITNVSHELRTPLNSIIGFSKIMKMGYDEESYDEHLGNIITPSMHLLKLINDIIDISKLDAGSVKFNIIPISNYSIVSSCVSLVSSDAEKKSIKIDNQCDTDENIKIMCDQKRLHQVFLNLLSNAIKFTRDGGLIQILSRADDDHVEVDIIDNGIGIKEANLGYIFGLFNQEETSLARGSQGIGLGLAITKKIVEALDGNISVKSKEGSGSTFTVRLPRLK